MRCKKYDSATSDLTLTAKKFKKMCLKKIWTGFENMCKNVLASRWS